MATFTLFSQLPLELRNLIWEFTIEPREVIVDQEIVIEFRDGASVVPAGAAEYWFSSTPVPAALHTSRESRSHLQSSYTKAFSYGVRPRYTWINFDADTVRIKQYLATGFAVEKYFVRRLILESPDPTFTTFYCQDMMRLGVLQSLTILVFESFNSDRLAWWGVIKELHEQYPEQLKTTHVRMIDIEGDEINSGNWQVIGREESLAPSLSGSATSLRE